MKFKTIKDAIDYLQCEGYEPTDLKNPWDYTCQTWEEVEEQLDTGEVHTYVGDWVYFEIEKGTRI